jgi:hypothetical protein
MLDQTERETERPTRPATLELPRQAPPVDRTGTTPGIAGDAPGVEADGFLTKLLSSVLPI